MPLIINGVTKPTNQDLGYGNGTAIENIYANGILIWALQKYYYISYNSNGGSGSMAQQTMPVGAATALAKNTFSRTGYLHNGWANSAAGGRAYTDGQSVTDIAAAGATKTLYALWNAITYMIAYNGNGATGGSTEASTHTYNVGKALNVNGYIRTYFAFAGWATAAGGAKAYNNGQTVTNLSSTNNATVNLYAVWCAASLALNTTDRCTPATGGWKTRLDWEAEQDTDYQGMVGAIVGGSGGRINIYTKNPIDFTYISRISINIQTAYCGGHFYAGISSDQYSDGVEAGVDMEWTDEGMIRQEVDVSGITGSKYFKIVAYPNNHCSVIIENITCS